MDAQEIREFDMDEEMGNWKDDEMPAVGVVAKRGAGKSKIVIAMIRRMAHRFGTGILLCPSQTALNKVFGDIFGLAWTHQKPTPELIEQIMNNQKRILDDPDSTLTEKERALLLVLDDVGSYKKLMQSEEMNQLLANGRQLRITIFITAQYLNQLNTQVRANLTYIVAFQEDNANTLKKYFDEYFGAFGSFGFFKDAMREFTVNRGVLIARGIQTESLALTDRVFYYKASLAEIQADFKVGDDFYWLVNDYYVLTAEERRERLQQTVNLDFSAPTKTASKGKFRRAPTKSKVGVSPSNRSLNGRENAGSFPINNHPEGYPASAARSF